MRADNFGSELFATPTSDTGSTFSFFSLSSEAIEDGEGKKVDDIKEESEKNRAKEKIKTTENKHQREPGNPHAMSSPTFDG